jgi:hypothetical protein
LPAKPEAFTIWPFEVMFANPCSYRVFEEIKATGVLLQVAGMNSGFHALAGFS